MNEIYRKKEPAFAVMWIIIYVAGTVLAETLSETAGVFKLFPALLHAALSVYLLVWLKKNGLFGKYGLMRPAYRPALAWFFLPLALTAMCRLFPGVSLRYDAAGTLLYVVSMLGVGFLEEIIFRGFLFRALEKDNPARAIVVSSVTFGIGHIVNLLNGQDLAETLLQIVFAVAVGFTLVILFHKGGSLIPCIVFHGLNNSLSAFCAEESSGGFAAELAVLGMCVVLLALYSVWNWKRLKI